MSRCVLTVFALVLLLPWHGAAQEQGAALEGSVRDAQGGLVPGVVVVARNASGFSVEALSDASGSYRLSALPSGAYELSASLSGFLPVRVVGIELALGVRLTVDLVFQPAGPNEIVEVVATSPSLAITQAVRATSVSGPLIEKMPRGRDFTSLALQAPGAANERKLAGISVDGASGAENRVIVDGVETTNTWVGTPGQGVVTDFIDELQVKSSGYSAEFGGSTGAVLNAVTKSGGNRWRGLGVLYWSGSVLDAAPRATLRLRPDDASRAEYLTYPEDRYTQIEPGFTLGGPLMVDRLWLFSGYLPSFRPLERTVTFRANQSTRTVTQDLTRQNGLVKVTARLSPRWRGKASFVTAREKQRNLLPAQDGTSDPNANFGVDDVTPNYSISAGVDYTPTGWAYLSVRGGYFARDSYNEGVYQGDRVVYQTPSLGWPGVPPPYQQPRGYMNVPSNIARDRARGPRFGIQVDGTASLKAAGTHELKAGVQVDRLGLDALSGGTGNNIGVFWGLRLAGAGGPYGYYVINSNSRLPNRGPLSEGAATVTNIGLFVQDAWRIGRRLTVHAGLRTENETVPSLSPDPNIPSTAIAFSFRDKLAPRLGFAWDVTGDGRTKAYSSWGIFYDITKLQLSFGFGAVNQSSTYFALETGDIGTIVGNPACPPTCPGARLRGPITFATPLNSPDDNHIDPDVQQMRLHEFVVGLEREVAPALRLNVRYIRKRVDRALEDVGTRSSPGGDYEVWVATPGQGKVASYYPEGGSTPVALPKARRNYDAVEASVDRRVRGGWAAGAAYTWSRLTGNYSGLAQSDEDGRVEPNVGVAFDYALRSFDQEGHLVDGVLATDRPHQVKLHALADLPFHTTVGVRWFGGTGAPRTREVGIEPGNPVMYLGRNSDGRLPFISQCDVHVSHVIRPGARTSVTLSLNVANLLNQDTVNNYYPTELFAGQNVAVGEAEYLQGVDMQTLIGEQQLVRDARFLLPSGFQPPRSMRVGLSISF